MQKDNNGSPKIELYRGVNRDFVGTVPLMPIVHESVRRLLHYEPADLQVDVFVLNVLEEQPIVNGIPVVEHLLPEFGYAYVHAYDGLKKIYQHPHTISDLITNTLKRRLLTMYPDEKIWGFRLDIKGMPQITPGHIAPYVQGKMVIGDSLETRRNFTIRRIEPESPPSRLLSHYGITPSAEDARAAVKIVLSRQMEEELLVKRPFSWEVEEGGFLLGNVFTDGNRLNGYIVEITDIPTAQHTGASLLHFTFTGDSFAQVKRMLHQNGNQERLLGWYHTHVFPATEHFGLSSIDVTLHLTTFTAPWQLAGLINLDSQTQRTLRFYVAEQNEMVLCPHWSVDERITDYPEHS